MPPNKPRNTKGMGSIKKRVRTYPNGKTCVRYEARYTEGYDPHTRKQIQRTITGMSKKEVSQKLKEALAALDAGTYVTPCNMTLGEWLDMWSNQYLCNVKSSTVASYKASIRTHLIPGLGSVRLDKLDSNKIQIFYNKLRNPTNGEKAISAKTVKNIHGILHRALQQAVTNGHIRKNPSDGCVLPRVERKLIQPLDTDDIKLFLRAVKDHPFELLFIFALFTGMREGEVLGLTWDRIDFKSGTILIDRQLQKEKKAGGQFLLVSLKNDRPRRIMPAPWVMNLLHEQEAKQKIMQQMAGVAWSNPMNLVFTNELGRYHIPQTLVRNYKKVVKEIGKPNLRFHDLRHSYAVASLQSGDDIKTLQGNLGHATVAFTLDIYGHVTNQMNKASSERMQAYISNIVEILSDEQETDRIVYEDISNFLH